MNWTKRPSMKTVSHKLQWLALTKHQLKKKLVFFLPLTHVLLCLHKELRGHTAQSIKAQNYYSFLYNRNYKIEAISLENQKYNLACNLISHQPPVQICWLQDEQVH